MGLPEWCQTHSLMDFFRLLEDKNMDRQLELPMWDESGVKEAVMVELDRATRLHGNFETAHHGYAVILEELDEMWDEIKANNLTKAKEEAIQVAAMAIRFCIDL